MSRYFSCGLLRHRQDTVAAGNGSRAANTGATLPWLWKLIFISGFRLKCLFSQFQFHREALIRGLGRQVAKLGRNKLKLNWKLRSWGQIRLPSRVYTPFLYIVTSSCFNSKPTLSYKLLFVVITYLNYDLRSWPRVLAGFSFHNRLLTPNFTFWQMQLRVPGRTVRQMCSLPRMRTRVLLQTMAMRVWRQLGRIIVW